MKFDGQMPLIIYKLMTGQVIRNVQKGKACVNEKDIMPFGKYKGKDIVDIPSSYLKWLAKQDWVDGPLGKAVEEELRFRTARNLHFEEGEKRRG